MNRDPWGVTKGAFVMWGSAGLSRDELPVVLLGDSGAGGPLPRALFDDVAVVCSSGLRLLRSGVFGATSGLGIAFAPCFFFSTAASSA